MKFMHRCNRVEIKEKGKQRNEKKRKNSKCEKQNKRLKRWANDKNNNYATLYFK